MHSFIGRSGRGGIGWPESGPKLTAVMGDHDNEVLWASQITASANENRRRLVGRQPAHDDEQPRTGRHQRFECKRRVPDARIARECDPAPPADFSDPGRVGGQLTEMIVMPLDSDASGPQLFGELVTQIAIREIADIMRLVHTRAHP